MPNLETLRVVLRERGTAVEVEGGTLCVGESTEEWAIPCDIPLRPGRHLIHVRHPSRTVSGENPRRVRVVISTDPGAPSQVEIVEVEPV